MGNSFKWDSRRYSLSFGGFQLMMVKIRKFHNTIQQTSSEILDEFSSILSEFQINNPIMQNQEAYDVLSESIQEKLQKMIDLTENK